MTLPPTFHGFADQSRIEHALTVIGGVIVCTGVYFASLDFLMGGVELAVSETYEATLLRRRSLTIAGVACFAYFSFAFIFARGGPLLSFLFYPAVLLSFGMPFVTWLSFGKVPNNLHTHGSFLLSPTFIRDGLWMGTPGIVTAFLIIGCWMLLTDNDVLEEWAETHLTEGFKEEFIEEAKREAERKRSKGRRLG